MTVQDLKYEVTVLELMTCYGRTIEARRAARRMLAEKKRELEKARKQERYN